MSEALWITRGGQGERERGCVILMCDDMIRGG